MAPTIGHLPFQISSLTKGLVPFKRSHYLIKQGKSKEMAESAEGGGLFSVGWPRSIFLKMWLLNRDLNEVRNRATWGAFQPEGTMRVQRPEMGAAWGVQGAAECVCVWVGGHSDRGQWRGGLWAEDMISLLLGEETSGGLGINRNTSQGVPAMI